MINEQTYALLVQYVKSIAKEWKGNREITKATEEMIDKLGIRERILEDVPEIRGILR